MRPASSTSSPALKDEPQTYDEAIAKYFLAQYVRAREGYSFVEAPMNFRTISLLSTQSEQTRFSSLYRGSNPDSPQVAYGRSGVAEIRIKAISLLGPNLASVRFLRETRRGDEDQALALDRDARFFLREEGDDLFFRSPDQPARFSRLGIPIRSGDRAMIGRASLLLAPSCWPLGFASRPCRSFALQQPSAGSRDARVRMVAYDPANVVKINGVIRASTQILFAEDEEIAHVAIGDSVSWEVAPAGNILFLKPREKHPSDQSASGDDAPRRPQALLSVRIVDRREFACGKLLHGALRLSRRRGRGAPGRDCGTSAARWRRARSTRPSRSTTPPARAIGAIRRKGSPSLEPDAVYDDGKETTLRFEGNREVPAIFLVASDGTESLVPKDVRGELVVVHAVARELRLRQGAEVLCIFNEAFDPVGVNQATRTTSPSVARLPRRTARAMSANSQPFRERRQ